MSRKIYPLMVEETKTLLSDAEAFVSVDLTGVTAAQSTALRKKITAAGGSLSVVKNTVARKSLEETNRGAAASVIDGPTALALGSGDAIPSVCRILNEWSAKTKNVQFTGGWMDDRVLSREEVGRLASIPPRKQLHSMVVGALHAPIARFVWTLSGLLRAPAIVLKRIAEGRSSDGQEGS